jgi:hypothetical protein
MSTVDRHADEERRIHATSLTLTEPPPAEVDAGTEIVLKARVSCRDGCDLRGHLVNIVAPDNVVAASCELTACVDNAAETAEWAFRAPDEVGEHSWAVVFAQHERENVVHDACVLPITVTTRPHDTSLAVWGVPSPIVIGRSFRVHVGATCSAGCDLRGKEVEICDEGGIAITRVALGDAPWDGTRSLYWTEVDLVAPARQGSASRLVRFAPAGLRLPHDGVSARFAFESVEQPQHVVTVKVVQKDTGSPVEDVQVRLGVYVAHSDSGGVARLPVRSGTYELDAQKTGYEMSSQIVDVHADVNVIVEVAIVPPVNYDDYWLFDPAKET